MMASKHTDLRAGSSRTFPCQTLSLLCLGATTPYPSPNSIPVQRQEAETQQQPILIQYGAQGGTQAWIESEIVPISSQALGVRKCEYHAAHSFPILSIPGVAFPL